MSVVLGSEDHYRDHILGNGRVSRLHGTSLNGIFYSQRLGS
jgi:hypothetical protein